MRRTPNRADVIWASKSSRIRRAARLLRRMQSHSAVFGHLVFEHPIDPS